MNRWDIIAFIFIVAPIRFWSLKRRVSAANPVHRCASNSFKKKSILKKDFSDDSAFNHVSWTTLIRKNTKPSMCGFFGQYETPKEFWRNGDCYSLTMDCRSLNTFKLISFHCQSGLAYQVTNYNCFASWKENDDVFIFTRIASSETLDGGLNANICFVCFIAFLNLFNYIIFWRWVDKIRVETLRWLRLEVIAPGITIWLRIPSRSWIWGNSVRFNVKIIISMNVFLEYCNDKSTIRRKPTFVNNSHFLTQPLFEDPSNPHHYFINPNFQRNDADDNEDIFETSKSVRSIVAANFVHIQASFFISFFLYFRNNKPF